MDLPNNLFLLILKTVLFYIPIAMFQVIKAIPISMLVLLEVIRLLPLFVLGGILYTTRILAHKKCYNWWFGQWTGSDEFAIEGELNGHLLAVSQLIDVFIETIPQLCLQIGNSLAIHEVQMMTLVSFAVSGAAILNSLYDYFYFLVIKQEELKHFYSPVAPKPEAHDDGVAVGSTHTAPTKAV